MDTKAITNDKPKVIKDTFKASKANEAKQARSGKTILDKENAELVKAAAKRRKTANLPKKSSEQVKVNREELDAVIRKALREGYGHPCPILGVLGQRFAVPSESQGYPFYRVLADVGKVPDGKELVAVLVAGFYKGGPGPKATISPVKKNSYTVDKLLSRIARKTKKAAEAKKARVAAK